MVNHSTPQDYILARLHGVKNTGTGYQALCPAHDDHRQSLSIAIGRNGETLITCHAGCQTERVIAALGLKWADLFPEHRNGNGYQARGNKSKGSKPKRGYGDRLELSRAEYPAHRASDKVLVGYHGRVDFEYTDENGKRKQAKELYWSWTVKGGAKMADLALYGWEDLDAHPDWPAILVEGERKRDALRPVAESLSFVVVGTMTGASVTPNGETLVPLIHRDTCLWRDNDEPGETHMGRIGAWLALAKAVEYGEAYRPESLRWVDWKDAPEHGDAADFLKAGNGSEELKALLDAAIPYGELDYRGDQQEAPADIVAESWQPGFYMTDGEVETADGLRTWVTDYVEYASTRTDAPPAFHAAVAFAHLSVAVGRKAELRLTTGTIIPTLWFLLVANSTRMRKSTALDFGDEIHQLAGLDCLTPDDFTPQRLITYMAERAGRPALFRRDEFAGFYSALNRLEHQTGTKQVMIAFHGGRGYRKELAGQRTKTAAGYKREPEKIEVRNPFFSVVAATQLDLFLDQADSNDISNGYLARHAFIVPTERTERKDIGLASPNLAHMTQHLAERLKAIELKGLTAMKPEPGVMARWNEYGRALEDEVDLAPLPYIAEPVFGRANEMSMKVAMLLAFVEGDVIRMPHLLVGIRHTEQWRTASYALLAKIGPAEEEKKLMKAAELIARKGRVFRGDVMADLRFSKKDMDGIEATLDERGWLIITRKGKGKIYEPSRILAKFESLSRGNLQIPTHTENGKYSGGVNQKSPTQGFKFCKDSVDSSLATADNQDEREVFEL